MLRAAEIRDRDLGLVPQVPTITYCELLKNRARYLGKKVSIYADMTHFVTTTRDGGRSFLTEYLYDPECDSPKWGIARTTERIGVAYPSSEPMLADELRATSKRLRGGPFHSRARVLVTGMLRRIEEAPKYEFEFEILEFGSVKPIILPYRGKLENGWTYSDTFHHRGGYEIRLSSPIKPPLHHTASIEWRNAPAFPALRKPGLKGITFRISSTTVRMLAPKRWTIIYNCDIIDVTS